MDKSNIKIIIGVISLCFLDLLSKIIISKSLVINQSIMLIDKIFYLTYVRNEGIAFSILSGRISLVLVLTTGIIAFIMYYLIKNKSISNKEKIGFTLILGGALGNLVDRLINGYVIDFINIYIFNYNYPIFNLADTFIVIGAIIIFLSGFSGKEKRK